MNELTLSFEKSKQLKKDYLNLERQVLNFDGKPYTCIGLFVVPSDYKGRPDILDGCQNRFFMDPTGDPKKLFDLGVNSTPEYKENTIVVLGRDSKQFPEFKWEDFIDFVNENSIPFDESRYN